MKGWKTLQTTGLPLPSKWSRLMADLVKVPPADAASRRLPHENRIATIKKNTPIGECETLGEDVADEA
jgi:hypothetical protein